MSVAERGTAANVIVISSSVEGHLLFVADAILLVELVTVRRAVESHFVGRHSLRRSLSVGEVVDVLQEAALRLIHDQLLAESANGPQVLPGRQARRRSLPTRPRSLRPLKRLAVILQYL